MTPGIACYELILALTYLRRTLSGPHGVPNAQYARSKLANISLGWCG